MKKLLFYYMSGTGNSYRAVQWSSQEAEKHGLKAKIIQVNKAKPKNDFEKCDETLLGIFFPTHGFTAPWPIIKLAFVLPCGKKTKVFINASRAGWMIGKWHLPGLEGTATLIIAIILWLKGYDVLGFQGIDMPSNWLAVHWGLKKENALWFIQKAEKKTKNFTEKILKDKRVYKGFIFIIFGILLSYISLMYLIAGRFMLAKIMFADYNCNSCGICWNNCPFNAIIPVGVKEKRPFWTFKCESCERCIAYCPKKAIQTGFFYIILFYWFVYGVIGFIPVLFFELISKYDFLLWLNFNIFKTAIYIGYMILWVFLGYFILFWGAKIKIINKIFTYTTPTKIYRRYNEPSVKISDMC